jgi:hypothetical protein
VRERVRVAAAGDEAAGRSQLLAVHTAARSLEGTDWGQVLALYDRLVTLDLSPIVRLNRAVAVAEVDGPEAGLREVDALGDAPSATTPSTPHVPSGTTSPGATTRGVTLTSPPSPQGRDEGVLTDVGTILSLVTMKGGRRTWFCGSSAVMR